jgi:glucose-1-phosphate thymidylyltransferase
MNPASPAAAGRRGILLAGGRGTRLHPITRSVNKQLLPIYDKPLIYYPLSVLMLAGIRKILLISSPDALPAFQGLLGDGARWGIDVSYKAQERPGGLPEAYLLGEEFLDGSASAMMLGDNLLYGSGLQEVLHSAGDRLQGATVFAYRVSDPRPYGVLTLDDEGHPLELEEKPEKPKSPWAVTGLYFLDETAPARARELRPSSRGELEITDLLRSYMSERKLRAEFLGRGVSWLDTGTPRALLQAAQFVEVLQERQGLRVACPEEIAFRMGFIDRAQLASLAGELSGTDYGRYLTQLLDEGPAPVEDGP